MRKLSYEPLVEAIPKYRTGQSDFGAVLAQSNADYRVRVTFGLLMLAAFRTWHPERAKALDPLLQPYLQSPFGTVSFPTATAFTVLLGTQAFPNLSVEAAGNAMIAKAFVENKDFPIMKTMLMACGHRWDTFIDTASSWGNIMWTIPIDMQHRDSNSVEMVTDAAALRYMNLGFWRAMMSNFSVSGEATITEFDTRHLTVRLSWN